MRIGPVLEVTTNFRNVKYGIEIRIESVNQDNSHSWVRISYGTVKYVIDSIQDNTETYKQAQTWLQRGQRQKQNLKRENLPGTTATIPIHQRRWIDIEPSKQRSCFVRSLEKSH